MTTKVIEVVTRVGILLQDISQDRWPESDLFRWIDDGQLFFVRFIPYLNLARESMPLTQGYIQRAPSDCIAITDIPANTGGMAITQIERMLLDAEDPSWTATQQSAPVIHVMFTEDPKEFLTYPARDGAPGDVDIVYGKYPTKVTDVAQDLSVLDEAVEALVDYVLYRGFDGDSDNAQNSNRAADYYARANRYVEAVTGKPMVFTPGAGQ